MSAPTIEDTGLICGFRLGPVESCGLERPNTDGGTRPVWLHFNLADARARRWLQDESGLDPAAVRALTDADPRVHLENLGRGVVAVLGDLHHDFDQDPEGFGKIRIYLDPERIITVRRHRLRTADAVRRDLLAGNVSIESPGALFEYFIQRLTGTFAEVVTKLADEVDKVEDEILAGRVQSQGMALGRVRRSIARLRRHMNGNRAALSGLRGQVPVALDFEHWQRRQTVERLEATAQDLEIIQERTRLLQEEIAGRLGEATNRNLFLLSTVTTALLPITLITGIFGMNVGGLPGVGDPAGFRRVMFTIVATVIVALVLIFRRREK